MGLAVALWGCAKPDQTITPVVAKPAQAEPSQVKHGTIAYVTWFGDVDQRVKLLAPGGSTHSLTGFSEAKIASFADFGQSLKWSPSGRYLLAVVQGAEHGSSVGEAPPQVPDMYNDLAVIDFENVDRPVIRRLTFDAGWFYAEWKREGIILAARTPAGLGRNPDSTGAFEFAAPDFQPKAVSAESTGAKVSYIATFEKSVKLIQQPGSKVIDLGAHRVTIESFLSSQRLGRVTVPLRSRSDERTGLALCIVANSALSSSDGYVSAALTIDSKSAQLISIRYFDGMVDVRDWRSGLLQMWQQEPAGQRLWILSTATQQYEEVGYVSGRASSPDWTPRDVTK